MLGCLRSHARAATTDLKRQNRSWMSLEIPQAHADDSQSTQPLQPI